MRIAIIPARGGSRRIHRKNLKNFHGKPIIAYSLETAKDSGLFDHIIVSTDDKEIADIAIHHGATDIHERRPEHAVDGVGTQEVAKSVLADYRDTYDPEYVCVIYPTAPMMLYVDLMHGFSHLMSSSMAYVYSVGTQSDFLIDAGQWYFGKAKSFLDGVPLFRNGYGLVIPAERVCDINTHDDWKRAEKMYAKLHGLTAEVVVNDQKTQWRGDFGDAYTNRNRVDWRGRIPFWEEVIDNTGARSVSEVGCNSGWNLSAINKAHPDVVTWGCDINAHAIEQAKSAGLDAWQYADDFQPEMSGFYIGSYKKAELVFTAGVLIHQNQADLKTMMEKIVADSFQYVLAIEYEAATEEEVNYRGMDGMLWRRPYGKMYEAMGLKLWQKWSAAGFDNCTAWLLEKP